MYLIYTWPHEMYSFRHIKTNFTNVKYFNALKYNLDSCIIP